MSEEELRKNDILFQIDMQLYDEFNDKLCEMDEHLGDIYSLRDIEEVKQAEKEKERELLREAIKKLQKENAELKDKIEYLGNEKYALYQDNISLLKEKYGTESLHYKYIETPPVEAQWYKSESYINDNFISKEKIRTEIKELEEILEKRKTIDIIEEINRLEELLGDE